MIEIAPGARVSRLADIEDSTRGSRIRIGAGRRGQDAPAPVEQFSKARLRTRLLGASDRLEYTVIGTPVNLAAKLEKHNKVEGTRALTTFGTYRRAVHQGYTRRQPGEQRPARSISDQTAIDLVVMAGGTSRLRGTSGTATSGFAE